jgi:hypothetical protein
MASIAVAADVIGGTDLSFTAACSFRSVRSAEATWRGILIVHLDRSVFSSSSLQLLQDEHALA